MQNLLTGLYFLINDHYVRWFPYWTIVHIVAMFFCSGKGAGFIMTHCLIWTLTGGVVGGLYAVTFTIVFALDMDLVQRMLTVSTVVAARGWTLRVTREDFSEFNKDKIV